MSGLLSARAEPRTIRLLCSIAAGGEGIGLLPLTVRGVAPANLEAGRLDVLRAEHGVDTIVRDAGSKCL